MAKIKTLSVQEAVQLLNDSDTMVLDCREVKDYRASHVENALHVHEGLKDALIKRGNKHRALLIYCYYGHASEHLAEFFSDFGFKHVYSLSGGYANLKESQDTALIHICS